MFPTQLHRYRYAVNGNDRNDNIENHYRHDYSESRPRAEGGVWSVEAVSQRQQENNSQRQNAQQGYFYESVDDGQRFVHDGIAKEQKTGDGRRGVVPNSGVSALSCFAEISGHQEKEKRG